MPRTPAMLAKEKDVRDAMFTFTTVTLPPLLALADAQRQADDAGGMCETLNTEAERALHRAILVYVIRKIRLGEFKGPPLWLNGTPSHWDSEWQEGINNGCVDPLPSPVPPASEPAPVKGSRPYPPYYRLGDTETLHPGAPGWDGYYPTDWPTDPHPE